MTHTLSVLPEAQAELLEAFHWYEERSKGLGAEFFRTVQACMSSIERNPEMYPFVYHDIRRALLRKFPFGIFYVIDQQRIAVLACFHSKRDPDKWRERK